MASSVDCGWFGQWLTNSQLVRCDGMCDVPTVNKDVAVLVEAHNQQVDQIADGLVIGSGQIVHWHMHVLELRCVDMLQFRLLVHLTQHVRQQLEV
jgi:hypothetical protein